MKFPAVFLTIAAGLALSGLACGGRTNLDVSGFENASAGGSLIGNVRADVTTGGVSFKEVPSSSFDTGGSSAASGFATSGIGTTSGGACCTSWTSSTSSRCCTGTNCTISNNGAAVSCEADSGVIFDVPLTCANYPAGTCGLQPDGLGSVLDCGPCSSCASMTCEQACANPLGGEPLCQSAYDPTHGWIVACIQLAGCGTTSTCWCQVG